MLNQTVGSFQFVMELEKTQQVEKPVLLPGEPNPQINSMVIRAAGGNGASIYIGGAGVTKANGFELKAGDAINVDLQGAGKVFAFGMKAADVLHVFWVGP